MNEADGTPPTCPNGHPATFAGQRFCEVCRAAIVGPAPIAPGAPPPIALAPVAPPAPTFMAPPPDPAPVAGGGHGRLLALAIGGIVVIALAIGAFALLFRPSGGAGASPTPAGVAVIVSPTPAPTPAPTATLDTPTDVIVPEITAQPEITSQPDVTGNPDFTDWPDLIDPPTLPPNEVPAKPTNARIETISDTLSADGTSRKVVEKVTWAAPQGAATEFRLYGVKFCPNDTPTAADGTPCLTVHTALPPEKLELVATAAGDARSMTIEHVIGEGICPNTMWCDDTYALVLAAYNEVGQSVFTIVKSSEICHTCTY